MRKPKPQSLAGRREALERAKAATLQSGEDAIILAVRLKSGGFESQVEVPVSCTPEERDRFVEAWLNLMAAGVQIGQSLKRVP